MVHGTLSSDCFSFLSIEFRNNRQNQIGVKTSFITNEQGGIGTRKFDYGKANEKCQAFLTHCAFRTSNFFAKTALTKIKNVHNT